MAANGTAGSAGPRTKDETNPHAPDEEAYFTRNPPPRALREALRLAGSGRISTPSESASEEDYDEESQKPVAVLRLNGKREKEQATKLPASGSKLKLSEGASEVATPSDVSSENGTLDDITSLRGAKVYTIASDDKELREILRRGVQRVSIGTRSCDGPWLMKCRPKNQSRMASGRGDSVTTSSRENSPRSTGRTPPPPTAHSTASSPCSGSLSLSCCLRSGQRIGRVQAVHSEPMTS